MDYFNTISVMSVKEKTMRQRKLFLKSNKTYHVTCLSMWLTPS